MIVGIAQIAPHLGDVQKNLESHLELIEEGRKSKADLLIFPELSLTGYTLQDMVEEVAISPEKSSVMRELQEISREISLAVGFVEEKEKGLYYNSSAFLSQDKITHIHRKVFLPTYGIFEEAKFYAQGKNFHTFPTPYGHTGMLICYDFLHYGASYLLYAGGAEIILVLSSAPGRGVSGENGFESCQWFELMGAAISRFSTAFVVYCNRVGQEDGKIFPGGSFIYAPSGELLVKAPYFEKGLILQDINIDDIRISRKKRLYKRDDKPEIILHALERIVRKYED